MTLDILTMDFEPQLMPYQDQPFNGDGYICAEFLMLKKIFGIRTVIETGTCLGYTTRWMAQNFKQVRSVELRGDYLALAEKRLDPHTNVMLYEGRSQDWLCDMLLDLGDNTLIFLDAHWGKQCPLTDELEIIAASGIRPVIAIHDFMVPDRPELGYDSTDGHPFCMEWLQPCFNKVYGKDRYTHWYNREAEGAMRGIIYLTKN